MSNILRRDYGLSIHWDAIKTYCKREQLYDVVGAAPSTPLRGTDAPATPTGSPMQMSPITASPRRLFHAKIADLPRYKNRIVQAIKANPGLMRKRLAKVLRADCGAEVHWQTLRGFCGTQKL